MSQWKIVLSDVTFDQAERDTVAEVMASGWLSMGPKTEAFENAFAEFIGCKHAVAVANGTAALHLALRVLDLEPGDEVIVPALTFVATSNAVLYNGLTPVFCDIESLETPVLSPEEIAWKITRNTRVIIPMHYAGYPCDIARLEMLQSRLQERPRRGSKKKDSIIVEDACHGVGGSYRGGRKM
ncbi:MAG: aminotransferase class I/II-fold pyridoxal phosphate-dependent enzyme, partial [bacterium]